MHLQVQITALAEASVQQLRETLRRVNALRTEAPRAPQDTLLAPSSTGEDASADWQETDFDVREHHA